MRKALVVGIDYYSDAPALFGCVNDANAVKSILERNYDGSINFDVRLLTGGATGSAITQANLRRQIRELFAGENDIALLYFAGHGYIEETGGYLMASDSRVDDGAIPLSDVLVYVTGSPARNKIVILDSCHSGVAGSSLITPTVSELKEGTTILTASTAEQYASESNGAGIFTSLFIDALNGGAGNLVGDVTPGSVYAHIDQSLGSWKQRPVFKTNVKSFVSLRKVKPPIALHDLQRIIEFFPSPGFDFPLDPSYEPRPEGRSPEMPDPNPVNTEKFSILQKYNRVNLVVPIGVINMWDAAMQSKACKLTALGEHYRRLVEQQRI